MNTPTFNKELKFQIEGQSLWDKGKRLFHDKLKIDEGGNLAQVQQFLSDNTTIKQALEVGENTRKKADGKYTGRIGRVLKKMQFFVQFGDIAIQHNPETTALVWAAFRMMLQVAVNDLETCELLTSACDDIAGTIFMCEVYERRYIQVMHEEAADIAQKVVEKIPTLYALVLEFSYQARKHLSRGKFSRFLKSGEGSNFTRLLGDIKKMSAELNDLAGQAFQKDVLTSLGDITNQSKEEFEELRNLVSSIIEDNKKTIQDSRMNQKAWTEIKDRERAEAEYQKGLDWLDRLEDPDSEHRLNTGLRQPNTCTWIFGTGEYKDWYQPESSKMLWVVGNAGFGKSVLLSSVIEELRKADDGRIVLYFFCKTGDDSTQRAGAIFRNLIAQIYQKINDNFPDLLEESSKILGRAQKKGGLGKNDLEYAKSVKNLKPALEDLAKLHGKPVFIVIDALDECSDREKEGLVNSLRGIVDASANIKILVASRPEADLSQVLEKIPKIEVGHNNNSEDIKAYLVEELNKLSSCSPKERKTALKEIIKRSAGMFRYANLAVDRLRQPWRRPIEKHLATFPDGLEAFYRQRFQQIKPELREVLVMTLRWTILAKGDVTPLLVAEDYRRVFDDNEGNENDGMTYDSSSQDDSDEDGDEEVEEGEGKFVGKEAKMNEGQKESDEKAEGEVQPATIPQENQTEGVDVPVEDEYRGMLDDTLRHVQEAGSVFVESTSRNSPLRLRHTSVKDFVLKEGSKRASLRSDNLCALCFGNEREQITPLSVTPKHGHLILSLTIFTHLNSEAFKSRYLQVTEEGESEAPNTGGEVVYAEVEEGQAADVQDEERVDEGIEVDDDETGGLVAGAVTGSEGEENGTARGQEEEREVGEVEEVEGGGEKEVEVEVGVGEVGSEAKQGENTWEGETSDKEKDTENNKDLKPEDSGESDDEEEEQNNEINIPQEGSEPLPMNDSGIDVTCPDEGEGQPTESREVIDGEDEENLVRRSGPLYRDDETFFWSMNEVGSYGWEFFDGPNGEKLEKIAIFVDSTDYRSTIKGLRFKRKGLGWGNYFGYTVRGTSGVAVFDLRGESIQGAFFQRQSGLTALSFETRTRRSPYYGLSFDGEEISVAPHREDIPIGLCWSRNPYEKVPSGLLYITVEDPQQFTQTQPEQEALTKEQSTVFKAKLEDAEKEPEEDDDASSISSEADSDYSPEPQEPKSDGEDSLQSLCRYELANWMYHLKEAERLWPQDEREGNEDWRKLWDLVEKFLCDSPVAFRSWQYKVWIIEYPYTFDEDSVGQAIHVAASYGLTGLVERLLKKGHDVNSANGDGITPLHLAAISQDPNLVKLLLENGANVDARDCNQTTPLGKVASKLDGSSEIAKLLLDHGAVAETVDWEGMTPLHAACQNGNVEMFRQLMEKGANVKAKDNIGETPLHKALRRADPPSELIEELIQHGADVNEQDNQSQAPLYEAAELGSSGAVSILLKAGADVNDDDVYGTTALHIAAASGHSAVVTLLVEHSADLNRKDKRGKTALSLAAQNGRSEVVSYLIEKQTEEDPERSYLAITDTQGRSALHRAAAKGHTEIVTKLLDAGDASSGPTQLEGNSLAATPLHRAAWGGHAKVVELLLKRGSDINAKNRNGQTPLDLALEEWPCRSESGFEAINECLSFMLKYSPELARNWNLFRAVISSGSVNIVAQMLDHGINPNELDEHEWSPMAIALQTNRVCNEMANLLLSRGAVPVEIPVVGVNGNVAIGSRPTSMSRKDKSSVVGISDDGMEVRSLRPESWALQGSIRANHPIPAGKYTFYYEVELQKVPIFFSDYPVCAIGICTEATALELQLPGWRNTGSIGYHGDDGSLHNCGQKYPSYGPKNGPGDVMGCGVDLVKDRIFFTKNGEFLGYQSIGAGMIYYPVIGLSEVTVARVNFGNDSSRPFLGYTLPDESEDGRDTRAGEGRV